MLTIYFAFLLQECQYSRCGRTDKGVSAYHQIVAFHLRSAFPKDMMTTTTTTTTTTTLREEDIPTHPNDYIEIDDPRSLELYYTIIILHTTFTIL